jgi:hypothetical protein
MSARLPPNIQRGDRAFPRFGVSFAMAGVADFFMTACGFAVVAGDNRAFSEWCGTIDSDFTGKTDVLAGATLVPISTGLTTTGGDGKIEPWTTFNKGRFVIGGVLGLIALATPVSIEVGPSVLKSNATGALPIGPAMIVGTGR